MNILISWSGVQAMACKWYNWCRRSSQV